MRLTHRALAAVLGALATAPATTGAQQRPCDARPDSLAPSRDLYCIELVPTPGLRGASGRVELGHRPGPFTISVSRDGHFLYAPTFTVHGLPAPSSLGDYSTYIAWAATPTMYPIVRLGEVGNGSRTLATIGLEKFLVLVSAERSANVSEPGGPIVLRGQSPSTRLQPPDILQFTLGAMIEAPVDSAEHDQHGRRDSLVHRHGAGPDSAPRATGSAPRATWTHVPMPAGIQMLPAERALVPGLSPYLPSSVTRSMMPPLARPRELVRLRSGDTLRLEAGVVSRAFKGRTYTMYGFNGQYPGPLIQVTQGAEIVVDFTNLLEVPTTVHWHGIRLDNRFDGVPDMTQEAVPPAGRFTYRLRFPDAGIYWYHPHVREDTQQDLGLYGNLMVRSPRPDYFTPANREEVLMLDDILIDDDGQLVPFGAETTTHALMGRFGNVFLVNGEPSWTLDVKRGEVVRFFLTNVSNTRTFNLSFPGARMKVVASDVGSYEREEWVESVVISPAERYVVHVRFDSTRQTPLINHVLGLDHLFGRFFAEVDTLGIVRVAPAAAAPDHGASFQRLRRDTVVAAEIASYAGHFDRPVDRALVLTLRTRNLPFVTRQLMQLDSAYFTPIEWVGTMPMMNWASTGEQVTWVLRDPATGRENMDIDWRFRVGDVVRMRLVNERQSFHAMQHPIHLHGQRFLVLSVNGVPQENRAWKDTVLLPAGSAVDILVEMSNPGRWMLHCHIAEHLSADMMMGFTVK
jgi:FtsP/CotA-like multicopper oxidase with cupredoxin domain